MEQLVKSLPTIIKAANNSAEVTQAACFAAWNYCAGEGLRRHAVPFALEENRLLIAVADPIWQRQLQTMLGQFLVRLNAVLGQRLVTAIIIRVQPELVPSRVLHAHAQRTGEGLSREITDAAAGISDPELRKAFLGAAESCLERLEKGLRFRDQQNSESKI